MADLLEMGVAWLGGMLKQHASQLVTYRRGLVSIEIQATLGRSIYEIDDGHSVLQQVESRDFLIQTADLVLGDEPTLPVCGDRILLADGSKSLVYEVAAFGGEPCFRYCEPYRQQLRIHTKHVDTEGA